MWAPTPSAARLNSGTAPVAPAATEGPFVPPQTQASSTRHNESVHSFFIFFFSLSLALSARNEAEGVGKTATFLPVFSGWQFIIYDTKKKKEKKTSTLRVKIPHYHVLGGYFSRSNQQVAENCKRLAAATSSGGIYSLLRQDENKSPQKIIATGLPIKMGNIFSKKYILAVSVSLLFL